MESLLDFGRLGVEEGGEGLEFWGEGWWMWFSWVGVVVLGYSATAVIVRPDHEVWLK